MKIKLVLLSLLCFLTFACGYGEKLKKGNEAVKKVESFKSENGRLPNSLNEIGIAETESGPVYYRKESETKYIVWFGKTLGESATYDSETQKWDNL